MYPEERGLFRGKKVITDVFKEARQQILVGYEPDIQQSTKTRAKPEDLSDSSGYITITEALLYFADLNKEHQESCDYYARKNKFEESADYTEKFS